MKKITSCGNTYVELNKTECMVITERALIYFAKSVDGVNKEFLG